MANDEWQTPQDLFDKLDEEFDFDLDVASTNTNNKCLCAFYYCKPWWQDALKAEKWYIPEGTNKPTCWMNPPYSRGNIDKFVKKAYEESQKGCTVVGLLPLRSASWFHKYVMKAHEIRFLTRRVKFIDPETGKQTKGSPNFDSIIVVWKPGHVDTPKVSSYRW